MEPGKLLEWRQTHYPRLQLTLLNKRWWSRGENQISGADGARLFSQADLVRYARNNGILERLGLLNESDARDQMFTLFYIARVKKIPTERLVQAGGEASKNSSGTAS